MSRPILKTMFISASALLIFGGGLVVGRWWGREKDSAAQNTGAQRKIKYQVRDAELLAELPEWEEWQYPGSKKYSSSTGGGFALGNIIEFAQPQGVVLTTSDDLAKVWAYYKEKCKLGEGTGITGSIGGSVVGASAAGITDISVADHRIALTFEAPPDRRLKARGFTVGTARYDLTVLVQQMEGEDRTCIFLVYRPNNAFLSLLKQVVSE
jgi:hypothetical protein